MTATDCSAPHLRPARPGDADDVAGLVYQTLETRVLDLLLGTRDPIRGRGLLAKLFLRPGSRLGYPNIHVAQVNGQVAGVLIAFPGEAGTRLDLNLARGLFSENGLSGLWRTLRLAVEMVGVEEFEHDELHVDTLSVSPDFRGNGIGTLLLSHAENLACKGGLGKCSLVVATENAGAVRLYERSGYHHATRLNRPFDSFKMIKLLENPPAAYPERLEKE